MNRRITKLFILIRSKNDRRILTISTLWWLKLSKILQGTIEQTELVNFSVLDPSLVLYVPMPLLHAVWIFCSLGLATCTIWRLRQELLSEELLVSSYLRNDGWYEVKLLKGRFIIKIWKSQEVIPLQGNLNVLFTWRYWLNDCRHVSDLPVVILEHKFLDNWNLPASFALAEQETSGTWIPTQTTGLLLRYISTEYRCNCGEEIIFAYPSLLSLSLFG